MIGVDGTQLSKIGGSNLGNNKTYDQIALTALRGKVSCSGIFDFDNALFASKWAQLEGEMSKSNAVKWFSRYVKF